MKKKNKRKKRKIKSRKKKTKIKRKISRKIKKRKISKKSRIRNKFKLPNLPIKKISVPQFKKQRKKLEKITFQKVLGFLLTPIFIAYDNFREKRKLEKLRKISLEKKEKEKQIREERRLRYEAKQQELRDEIKLAKEREQDLKKFIRQEQAVFWRKLG